jgi:hypothetical protein
MISILLFSLSSACFVAMVLPSRPTQAHQTLETYYVCGPESLPNTEMEVALPALAGEPRA